MRTSLSMRIDNEYIEDRIKGFTILSVSGRESISKTDEQVTVGTRRGALLRNIKYEPRTLTIGFAIESDVSFMDVHDDWKTSLLKKLSTLWEILDVKNAKFIFDDESDVYYLGTPVGSPEVQLSLGVATGSFEIFCEDPFKYSNEVITIEAETLTSEDTDEEYLGWDIFYEGTAPASPKFTTEFYTTVDKSGNSTSSDDGAGDEGLDITKGECGYVAFMDKEANILQFGNPNEPDDIQRATEPTEKVMINNKLNRADTWDEIQYDSGTGKGTWRYNVNGYSPNVLEPSSLSLWKAGGSPGMAYRDLNTGANEKITKSTLLSATTTTTTAKPHITYTVTCTVGTSDRKETTVKLNLTIKCKVAKTASMTKSSVLKGIFSINGSDVKTVTLKKSGKTWGKGTTHTITSTLTLTELSAYDDTFYGLKFRVVRSDSTSKHAGQLSNKTLNRVDFPKYLLPDPENYYLTIGTESYELDTYKGPNILRYIGTANGIDDLNGATMCDLSWETYLSIGDYTNAGQERGGFSIFLIGGNPDTSGASPSQQSQYITMNSSGEIIGIKHPKVYAGITIHKGYSGSRGSISYWVRSWRNGADKLYRCKYDQTKDGKNGIAVSYTNTNFGHNEKASRSSYIKKTSTGISFKLGGKTGVTYNFTSDDLEHGIDEQRVYAVMIGFYNYSTYTPLKFNGISSISLTKRNIDNSDVDVLNVFHNGDILDVDTMDGSTLLNGLRSTYLGALGNDWEKIKLNPGNNQISCVFSKWLVGSTNMREITSEDLYDETAKDEGRYYKGSNPSSAVAFTPTVTESYDVCGVSAIYDQNLSDAEEYYIYRNGQYIAVAPTYEEFVERKYQGSTVNYYTLQKHVTLPTGTHVYIKESCEPKFTLSYEEAYL